MNQEIVKTAENYILTLDFWGDMIGFAGHELKCGSLACMILNMPEETVLALYDLCQPLCDYIYRIAAGRATVAGRDSARHSIYQIIELLDGTEPFCWLNTPAYRGELDNILSPENLKRVQKDLEKGPEKRGKIGQRFLDYIGMFAVLGGSVRGFREVIGGFADKLDAQESRKPESYARAFAQYFPLQAEDENSWMAMVNVTEQYMVTGEPSRIVKRKHYVSFVGLFRAELYEALMLGHAPKKCQNCGWYFLLTDATRTKYCNGFAPGDGKGRTCRQIGSAGGRGAKERAADHPYRKIYETLTNTVNHRVKRGTMSAELGAQVKKLAKRKLQRAIRDSAYAAEAYEQEMKPDTLVAEVLRAGR